MPTIIDLIDYINTLRNELSKANQLIQRLNQEIATLKKPNKKED